MLSSQNLNFKEATQIFNYKKEPDFVSCILFNSYFELPQRKIGFQLQCCLLKGWNTKKQLKSSITNKDLQLWVAYCPTHTLNCFRANQSFNCNTVFSKFEFKHATQIFNDKQGFDIVSCTLSNSYFELLHIKPGFQLQCCLLKVWNLSKQPKSSISKKSLILWVANCPTHTLNCFIANHHFNCNVVFLKIWV